MASITKLMNISKNIGSLCNRLATVSFNTEVLSATQNFRTANMSTSLKLASANFHTSSKRYDLMEFFDDKKNWGENEVKVGREWKLDELRIKSNSDLHKLWFVLLKERNMLMTMEHECNDKMEMFPSPERIDKVNISMENLEEVVRERNRAYHLLETGENGERPGKLINNKLGIKSYYKFSEHVIPPYMNAKWFKTRQSGYGGRAVRKFIIKYREKLYNVKRKQNNRNRNHVMMLLRRNPNLDINRLREQYPDVDINKLVRDDNIRGHYVPKV